MNIVVIGLGSMGKRRLRLLKKLDPTLVIFGVDNNESRRDVCSSEYGILTSSDLDDVLNKHSIDCAFVCTSPLSHSSIISQCLENNLHVFTELNLVPDGYVKNIALASKSNLVLFLSSTFLYREEIRAIRRFVWDARCSVNYVYHVGQYLPDWHPWEDYKDFFVNDKRSNGCREILAIELPWLTDVFGEVVEVEVMKSKMTSLRIDYDDNYMILLQHSTGHKGMLAADVVSRKAVRNLEIYGENIFLQWDGSPTGLRLFDYNKQQENQVSLYNDVDQRPEYSRFIVENAYMNEIIAFFEAVEGNARPIYDFEKDKVILQIIDEIEAR